MVRPTAIKECVAMTMDDAASIVTKAGFRRRCEMFLKQHGECQVQLVVSTAINEPIGLRAYGYCRQHVNENGECRCPKFWRFNAVHLPTSWAPAVVLGFRVQESIVDHNGRDAAMQCLKREQPDVVGCGWRNLRLRGTSACLDLDKDSDSDLEVVYRPQKRQRAEPGEVPSVAASVPCSSSAPGAPLPRELVAYDVVTPAQGPAPRGEGQRRVSGQNIQGGKGRRRVCRELPARPAYIGIDESHKLKKGGHFEVVYLRGDNAFEPRRIFVQRIMHRHVHVLDCDCGFAFRTYFRHCFGEVVKLSRGRHGNDVPRERLPDRPEYEGFGRTPMRAVCGRSR
jgi:hypothetical protein